MKLSNWPIKVSYVKINLDYEIISYNQNFINFFDLENVDVLFGRSIVGLIPQIDQTIYLKLHDLCEGEQKSVLIFKNHRLTGVEEPLVAIIYVAISREADTIVIRVANWLNWIWQINSSFDNSYNVIVGMEETKYRKKIRQLVEMYWLKALSPLLMHIPNRVIGMINPWTFFDILKIFNNKRGEHIFSKDYNRDMISRIRHNIKRDLNLKEHVPIDELLKDNQIINLKYNDELFIPHTVLEESIVLAIDKDMLLEDILDMYMYRDTIIK